jgi:hypothetical protein
MEQDHKPVHEHQQWLNNAMREVVRKEVLKPLKARVIYPISNSEWVSPVQVMPLTTPSVATWNGGKRFTTVPSYI